jgi:glycosyltransferase involved in cell wall biosynthesis
MRLSLVIPFYNEEENIDGVVNGLAEKFEKASIDYELILVNNGSIDNSPQMLEGLAKERPSRVKVVHVQVNQGYGWGIINGLREVSGEFVGFMCGDGQIDPESVLSVYNLIIEGSYDLVKVKRTARYDGVIRKAVSIVYNFGFLILFNVKTMDVNGSPKIWKRELLNVINPVSRDWFIDAEIMMKAKYLNLNMEEVPVEFLRREKGRSHVAFMAILEFVSNMFYYKFGKGMREWKQKVPKS